MHVCIYIYIHIHIIPAWEERDSIRHHLLEVAFEMATAPELRQNFYRPTSLLVVVVFRIGLPIAYLFSII